MIFQRRLPDWIQETYRYHALAGFFWGLFFGFLIGFIPVVARRINATPSQIAFITSAPFLGYLFTFLWAPLTERRRKMSAFLLPRLISRLILFSLAFTFSPLPYTLLVFLFWIVQSMAEPPYAAIVEEIYPREIRGRILGYISLVGGGALIFSSFLGGWLLDHFGQKISFSLGTIFGLLDLFSFQKIRVESDGNPSSRGKISLSFKEVWTILSRDREYLRWSLIYFLFGFGNLMAMPLYPIFLVDILRLSNTSIGKLAALTSLAGLFAPLWWGKLIDREGSLKLIPLAIFLASLSPLIHSLAQNICWLILAAFPSGFVSGGLYFLWLGSILHFAPRGKIQTYTGIQTTLMGMRGVIAPFVGIILTGFLGIRWVFLISFLIILFSFFLFKFERIKRGGRNELSARSA